MSSDEDDDYYRYQDGRYDDGLVKESAVPEDYLDAMTMYDGKRWPCGCCAGPIDVEGVDGWEDWYSCSGCNSRFVCFGCNSFFDCAVCEEPICKNCVTTCTDCENCLREIPTDDDDMVDSLVYFHQGRCFDKHTSKCNTKSRLQRKVKAAKHELEYLTEKIQDSFTLPHEIKDLKEKQKRVRRIKAKCEGELASIKYEIES